MLFSPYFYKKILATFLVGVLYLGNVVEARLVFSSEDSQFTENGEFVIDKTDDFDQVDLRFGEVLDARIQYDKTLDKFLINRNLDLENLELLNTRLENLAAAPTCDGTLIGKIYYNTVDSSSYTCNGTVWSTISTDTKLRPYIGGITPGILNPSQTLNVTIAGGNFEPGIVFNLGPEVTVNTTTISSDQTAILNITTSGSDQAPFLITAQNGSQSHFGTIQVSSYLLGTINHPAASCYEMKQEFPASVDANYWIKTQSMGAPQEFYCDMTYDGGGWALVGRGREGWNWNNSGEGAAAEVLLNVGTTSAFVPKYYNSVVINDLLDGKEVKALQDGVRIKRSWDTTGSQYQENIWFFQTLTSWDWVFDTAKNITHLQKDPGAGSYTNFGTRNSRDSNVNNDNDRSFTWAWASHNNKRGFSYGSAINAGTNSATNFLWEFATESHSIPYSEVYVRPKSLGSGGSSGSIGFTPYISTTNTIVVGVSSTTILRIDGDNFVPGTTVSIPGFDGTINGVTIISPTELEIDLTTGVTETEYDIVLSNGSFSNTVWAGNGKELFEVKNLTILTPGNGTTNWERISTNVATSLGKLVPTITGSGWDKGASFGTVPANTDFTLTFNPVYMAGQSTGGYAMIGMDGSDPNYNYNTMDYAIYLQNGTNLYVYENGGSKGNLSTWTVTDTLKVKRIGTTITYLKNGVVFYTSLTASSTSMVFDSSLYRYLGAENITLSY